MKAIPAALIAYLIPYLADTFFVSGEHYLFDAGASLNANHYFVQNSCLRSLRQHICPLCRSPFEDSDVRRIHVDRYEQNADGSSIQRMPSPPRVAQPPELAGDNALGLFNDNPHASEHATQLHDKITDLVLRSSSSNGVRGVRELIHEIQDFFNAEVPENVSRLFLDPKAT